MSSQHLASQRQQSFPSSSSSSHQHPSADREDHQLQYQYAQPNIPGRGLSVRRSLIHERSTYAESPSPPPPPEVQLPSQVYNGQQTQSLLQQHHNNQNNPRVPAPKWGLDRGKAYSSVPCGDPELDEIAPAEEGRVKKSSNSKSRSRSPKKKDRMSDERGAGIAAGAVGVGSAGVGESRFHPGSHPDSTFSQLRERRRSFTSLYQQQDEQYDPPNNNNGQQPQPHQQYYEDSEYFTPHASTPHGHYGATGDGYSPSTASSARGFVNSAAPIARTGTPEHIAPRRERSRSPLGVVGAAPLPQMHGDRYHRQSGDGYSYANSNNYTHHAPQQQYYNNNYTDYSNNGSLPPPPPPLHAGSRSGSSTSLQAAGAAVAAAAGLPAPNAPHIMGGHMSRSSNASLGSHNSNRRSLPVAGIGGIGMGIGDGPYNRLSQMGGSASALGLDGQIDVNMLDENDPDDGLASPPPGPRHGILVGLRGGRSSLTGSGAAVGAAGGAAAGAGGAGLGGDANASNGLLVTEPGAGPGVMAGLGGEKESDWLASQRQSKKKTRTIAIIIAVILLLAIAGGVTAGVLLSKKKSSGDSSDSNSNNSKTDSEDKDGGKDIVVGGDDDGAWKDYLDNPKLHKVFHGIDYTPLDALYPECVQKPPTQSQINIDIAIMSQLTSRIRLYGTDCNQAELVLNAIQTTGVDMKIWLGIWLDGNSTTNARSLEHMYDILDKYPIDLFEGVVIGNEVLFRLEMDESTLGNTLAEIKTNLTGLGIDLPIGTSDLGSKWTTELASKVDVLMANIHPFFGGVAVKDAATWTMEFFANENEPKAKAAGKRAMISEVGWPTDGGTLQGSVAGVDELNTLLKDWVCARLKDGTEYYWFSAFDEPWKKKYNVPGKAWEDKWGLLDEKREMKDGVEIPEC